MRRRPSGIVLTAARVAVAERAAYRGDFVITVLVSLLFELVVPLVTALIYGSGASFPGWSVDEALLIQAVFLVARGIAFPCFFGMVWVVFEQVREGTFELTLLRPRSPLLTVILRGFDPQGFGRLIGGIGLFALVVSRLRIPGPANVFAFLALFALSLLALFAFALFLAGSLFIWPGNGRLFELLDSFLLFGQYPASVFNSPLQFVLAVALPVSAIALFPAQALLGRPGPLLIWSIPSAAAFFVLALAFWRRMVGKYSGGGG